MKSIVRKALLYILLAGSTFIIVYITGWSHISDHPTLYPTSVHYDSISYSRTADADSKVQFPLYTAFNNTQRQSLPVAQQSNILQPSTTSNNTNNAVMISKRKIFPTTAPILINPTSQQTKKNNEKLFLSSPAQMTESITKTAACLPQESGPVSLDAIQKTLATDVRAQTMRAPQILFDKDEYDFGTVFEGETVKHTYLVENRGDAPLVIHRILASCDCASANLSKNPLDPRESASIEVSFLTQGYDGKAYEQIYVESNDPQKPRANLILRGIVRKEIEAEPAYIYFKEIKQSESVSRTVKIESANNTQFNILGISAASPTIRISQIKKRNRSGYEFDVIIGPGFEVGRNNTTIIIETDHKRQTRLTLDIFINVIP